MSVCRSGSYGRRPDTPYRSEQNGVPPLFIFRVVWYTGVGKVKRMFREMEYVYAVYQERSFTRAAQKMYLSQPALSAMVKKAEKKVGLPLFDRSTSPLTLTPAGEYYIQQAERIRQIQQDSKAYFSQISHNRDARVRICGAAIYQAYVFPRIVAAFQEKYPEISVTWIEERTGLVQKLLTRDVDLFPEVNNFLSKEVDGVAWKNEELVLVVPRENPLNEGMEAFRFTPLEIREKKHLLPEAETADLTHFRDMKYVLMDEENDTYLRAATIFANADITPALLPLKPSQMLTAYQLAAQSGAATIVSDTLVAYADINYPFYLYKLADPIAKRQQFLYFRRGKDNSAAVGLFREFLLHYQHQKGEI